MIVKPKIRDFICTTAHPKGAFENVKRQIEYIKSKEKINESENALIIGCSTGYGLSSRIAAAFLKGCNTLGVMYEKEAKNKRTATAGWYNTAFFEEFALKEGLYAKTINADAFSEETMEKVIKIIKKDLNKISLIIYSLAAPRRTMPDGTIVSSVLKTTNEEFKSKSLNLETKEVFEVLIPPATEEETKNTIKVMGGDNLKRWIEKLNDADVLEKNTKVISFSYEGPDLTHKIYKDGTIGKAKQNLLEATNEINKKYENIKAYVSLNKALVTQSSAAIPVVPLYLTILYKIMKEQNLHEGCIEQAYRLFKEKLTKNPKLDEKNRIRLDDYEMLPSVQQEVKKAWEKVNTTNLEDFADLEGYKKDFLNMFGFSFENVNYDEDVDVNIKIKSLSNEI